MIPIGTDRGLSRRTVVNHLLVASNIAVFVFIAMVGINSEQGVEGVFPIIDRLKLTHDFSQPWRLITYAFVHDMTSAWHLVGNMLFLWVFGPNVEDRLGRLGYLVFYLAGAAAAGAGHLLTSTAPAIGASGATAAVTGAYVVLFPRTQIRVLFIFFLIGIIHLSALWFVTIEVILNLWGALVRRSGNIAYTAHLAGYAYGFVVAFLLLVSGRLKSEPFDMFNLIRQARRRAEMREAYREQQARTDTAFASTEAPRGEASLISELQRPVADARAEIAKLMAEGKLPPAASAYRSLVEKYGLVAGAATMSRRMQLDLANHFFQTEDFALAVASYERFLEAYPRDTEAPHVRLMLAIICSRYLAQAARARALIQEALPGLRDADQRQIAADLLAELNAQSPAASP